MASGTQSKRKRAAAPPPVRSKGSRRQASPRVLLAGAGVVAAIVVAVVLAVVLTGGGSSNASVPAQGSLTNGVSGAAAVQKLLQGIPQHGNVLGSPTAPVTMIEYVDLQCPYCQQFETQSMTTLIPEYVRTGKVKVELRSLAFIGPDSVRGRDAAIAAGDQNKLFDLAQLLYANQGTENTGWLSDGTVTSTAASIPGLDVPKLLSDRNSSSVADRAAQFDSEATTAGVDSTPTILVGKTGSTPKTVDLASPTDTQAVATAIAAAS